MASREISGMARLEDPDGTGLLLLPRTLLGRSPDCDLVVGHPSVSSHHAVLLWSDERWWIRDLGSRNGTRVDHTPMAPGVATALREGSRIQLGLSEVGYDLVSAAPPGQAPAISQTVEPTLSYARIALRFRVSSDEEHAGWGIECGHRVIDLGDRVHTYLILTLARARLRDAGRSEADRGWCYADELARQLHITPEVLKVYVYRARQQLLAAGVVGARQMVERRATTNQIRLGTDRIVIERA